VIITVPMLGLEIEFKGKLDILSSHINIDLD